ncbi:hypothetical protein B9479_005989 [Cryptococcus floricola]|uniref:Uncharacterized protein n=1 Tax=Cryptococcus floricola TaxID=2591691 RepID=A0A5D3AT36_9TREE|nr:hypothetical protein B9479_005989 [Cryptococcus floricola]
MSSPPTIPSSLLPRLPKSQYTLHPLLPADLLVLIAHLRTLYLPPIHGGFQAADVLDDGDGSEHYGGGEQGKDKVIQVRKETREKKRERRFSAGLVETMGGMGLGLDVPLTAAPEHPIVEDQEAEEKEDENEGEDAAEAYESEQEEEKPHLDPFEREWSEKWLNGLVRRSQGWLEENEEDEDKVIEIKEVEAVLRDATAVLAMMAGTSAAGSFTRHLVFPMAEYLGPALSQVRSKLEANPLHSPSTSTFLASFSQSPTSPLTLTQHLPSSPTTTRSNLSVSPTSSRRTKYPLLPILLHDAPMNDHLSVGVQTWGSAILLGRQISLHPADYGLFLPPSISRGVRVLELGAGTGLLSILGRKLLDLHAIAENTQPGLVVATDFLPSVLDNLKVCVDLNFPPAITDSGILSATDISRDTGIHVAKLDWTTFPAFMASGQREGDEETALFVKDGPFDLVLASDCVYDETHARLLREVAGWVLRLPEGEGDQGGTFHILSPLRPTFQPEIESIVQFFPPHSTYTPLAERQAAASSASSSIPPELRGEGLGTARGLKLGTRGDGKRAVKGRKGEGRTDEALGYWWWEVGWA